METAHKQPAASSEQGNAPDPDRLVLVEERETTANGQKQEQPILGEDRLLVLCDGVFAIAITLLVLNIKLPSNITSEEQFNEGLGSLLGQVYTYLVTFVVVAAYWSQHRRVCARLSEWMSSLPGSRSCFWRLWPSSR